MWLDGILSRRIMAGILMRDLFMHGMQPVSSASTYFIVIIGTYGRVS